MLGWQLMLRLQQHLRLLLHCISANKAESRDESPDSAGVNPCNLLVEFCCQLQHGKPQLSARYEESMVSTQCNEAYIQPNVSDWGASNFWWLALKTSLHLLKRLPPQQLACNGRIISKIFEKEPWREQPWTLRNADCQSLHRVDALTSLKLFFAVLWRNLFMAQAPPTQPPMAADAQSVASGTLHCFHSTSVKNQLHGLSDRLPERDVSSYLDIPCFNLEAAEEWQEPAQSLILYASHSRSFKGISNGLLLLLGGHYTCTLLVIPEETNRASVDSHKVACNIDASFSWLDEKSFATLIQIGQSELITSAKREYLSKCADLSLLCY